MLTNIPNSMNRENSQYQTRLRLHDCIGSEPFELLSVKTKRYFLRFQYLVYAFSNMLAA